MEKYRCLINSKTNEPEMVKVEAEDCYDNFDACYLVSDVDKELQEQQGKHEKKCEELVYAYSDYRDMKETALKQVEIIQKLKQDHEKIVKELNKKITLLKYGDDERLRAIEKELQDYKEKVREIIKNEKHNRNCIDNEPSLFKSGILLACTHILEEVEELNSQSEVKL